MSKCAVEYDLNKFEEKQERLEQEWDLSKEDKQGELVDLVLSVINRDNDELIEVCFSESFNMTSIDEFDYVSEILDNLSNEDLYSFKTVAMMLDKLCYYSYGVELDEVTDHPLDLVNQVFERL